MESRREGLRVERQCTARSLLVYAVAFLVRIKCLLDDGEDGEERKMEEFHSDVAYSVVQ